MPGAYAALGVLATGLKRHVVPVLMARACHR
jgi:hypothetical protein